MMNDGGCITRSACRLGVFDPQGHPGAYRGVPDLSLDDRNDLHRPVSSEWRADKAHF